MSALHADGALALLAQARDLLDELTVIAKRLDAAFYAVDVDGRLGVVVGEQVRA